MLGGGFVYEAMQTSLVLKALSGMSLIVDTLKVYRALLSPQ
jgi:hypothetical protein